MTTPSSSAAKPSGRTAAVKSWIEGQRGAVGQPLATPRAPAGVLIYKVMGKMFAILSTRGTANVILKCDPYLAQLLRKEYAGVGHRSHLDKRFWISVELEADVPLKEIKSLIVQSHKLVCATLTLKQQAALEKLSS
jgi:predicted DNA-binding protein (MmcQ/YjbR family)